MKLYAQVNLDNIVDYIVDFETYGEDWEKSKTLFETSGLRYIPITLESECESGFLYDEQSGKFVNPNQQFFEKNEKTTNGFETNKYFLTFSSVDSPNLFWNGNKQEDIDSGNLLNSINGQILYDGKIVINEFNKKNENIFYDNIYVLDENRKLIKHVTYENIHHECILGTNTPRYYSPEFDYTKTNSNFLLLTFYNVQNENISNETLLDNSVIELDWDGNVLWQWNCAEHFDELQLSEDEKNEIKNNPMYFPEPENYGIGHNWIHLNSAVSLGENKWYENGDDRFHPENIICSARNINTIFIISKETKQIVWVFKGNELENPFLFQHDAHLIPKGLDGAGNLLFFDNGSSDRKYSRILEINPQTKQIVFEYKDELIKSEFQSSIQKMQDGNYLIGCSNSGTAVILDKNKNIVNEFSTKSGFYRVTQTPKEWFVSHDYTQEELEELFSYGKKEEVVSDYKLDLYESYLDQVILAQEGLTNMLIAIN